MPCVPVRRAHSRRRAPARMAGFSLIEIMVTVSLVAVLARFAIPTYQSYVLRGKVSQAFSQLSAWSIGMQQVYQDNRSYSGGGATTCLSSGAGAAPTLNTGDFAYSCSNMSASTFTLSATGKSGTSVYNYVYTLDNTGARTTSTPSGAAFPSSASCWVASSNGGCY